MTVMLWAEATSDAFEGPPGRAARMQIDHKMVNPAPGMAVSPVRVALPASRAKKPQCVAWIRISNSVVVFRHSFAAPRRDAPELCINLSPFRGRGERRMPVAPAASCALCSGRTHTSNNEYTGITRRSRTQWFTVSFVLSPAIGLFCHRHLRNCFHRLDTSVEISGPHDFTVRIGIARLARRRDHRNPSLRP